MVQASKISVAPLLLETWRAAGWGGSGICIGYLPWEVFQVCPSGRTTLGRTQDLGWSWDPPGRAGGHVQGECSCSNRLLDRLDLYFTVQHILSDSPNLVYVTPANQLVSFQIPVACKSCPCGYVFISRKLLNAKLNERSSPAIAGRPFLSLCICACVCRYCLKIILDKDG